MKLKIAGLMINLMLVVYTYIERGYFAIGSEWLIIPIIKLIKLYVNSWRGLIYENQRSKY